MRRTRRGVLRHDHEPFPRRRLRHAGDPGSCLRPLAQRPAPKSSRPAKRKRQGWALQHCALPGRFSSATRCEALPGHTGSWRHFAKVGSKVRIPSPYPLFLNKIKNLAGAIKGVFCFPGPVRECGEAGGKQLESFPFVCGAASAWPVLVGNNRGPQASALRTQTGMQTPHSAPSCALSLPILTSTLLRYLSVPTLAQALINLRADCLINARHP
jgi:hypothetical protein